MDSKTFSSRLIAQGWIAAAAMALMVVLSLFDPLHDSMTQHMSEIISGSWWSALAIRVLPGVMGVSIFLFGLGCFGRSRGWSWSGIASLLFGAAMVANGVFPAGNPLHGLYGLAVFSVLVPVFYAAEYPAKTAFKQVSLAVAFVSLLYMWLLLVGLEPPEYRGMTQRVASLASFGWFALAAFARWR
ncbi:MAG: hypothetical protein AAF941_10270 [Pseudomonadota bacterium]